MKLSIEAKTWFSLVIWAFTLFLPQSLAAEKQTMNQLLQQFERQPSAATGNRIMKSLAEEKFLDQPIWFTPQMTPDSIRQQVYYWAGEWLYNQQEYEEARQAALKALPLFHPGNGSRADCLNLIAITYLRLSDFSNAANYARQCLEIDMKSGDDDLISSSMNTVAGIYMAANQPKEAEKYILGAIEHSQHTDNPPRRAVILGMASEIYHKLGDDEKALSYAEKAYNIDKLLGRKPQATIRLSQKGYALLGLGRYQEAEEVFAKVLPEFKSSGDQHSYAIVLNNMGRAMLCQERPREAIPYFKEASAIFSGMGDLYNQIHSHRGLYESYWEIKPDSAKIELNLFNQLKDSLYTHSTAEALSRYNAEFGNDLLQKENSEMREKNQRTLIIGAILLLLTLLVFWLIIRLLRRRYLARMHKLLMEIEHLHSEAAEVSAVLPEAEEESPLPENKKEENEEDRQFLIRVIDIVNKGMADGVVSVERVASDMNMGVQSFRRRLQSAAGETPKVFFTAIQMEHAASLLTSSPDMQVSHIAMQCGFENISSFSHTFRRIYNCSPTQYREKGAQGRRDSKD